MHNRIPIYLIHETPTRLALGCQFLNIPPFHLAPVGVGLSPKLIGGGSIGFIFYVTVLTKLIFLYDRRWGILYSPQFDETWRIIDASDSATRLFLGVNGLR